MDENMSEGRRLLAPWISQINGQERPGAGYNANKALNPTPLTVNI